ncbi:MAG: hypothetical protein ACYCZF_16945 [Anaerolineae bacterium]
MIKTTEAAKQAPADDRNLGWFEEFIYLWVIAAGLGSLFLGKVFPGVSTVMQDMSWQGLPLPLVAVVFFVMLPPMARIQFAKG